MKVAISTSSFATQCASPLKVLEERGLAYVLNPHGRTLTEDELVTFADGCHGLVAGTEKLSKRVLEALPDLRVVSRCGVGADAVDKDALKALGKELYTTESPALSVAELTLAVTLDLFRHVSCMDRDMRGGIWRKRMGHCLTGKNVGIVGFGFIGQAVAQMFAPFCQIAYYDPRIVLGVSPRFRSMRLEELLGWADIVTVHCSCPPEGENVRSDGILFDRERLMYLREGAWFVNMSRGGIVDEEALADMLRSGHLAGAALDVFADEPYTGALLAFDNVVLTPHCASYTREERIRMEVEAVKKLLHALEL